MNRKEENDLSTASTLKETVISDGWIERQCIQIVVDKKSGEEQKLEHIGHYLARLFAMFGNDKNNVIPLYIDIPRKIMMHHILSVCFNGLLSCCFINQIESKFISTRCINKPVVMMKI